MTSQSYLLLGVYLAVLLAAVWPMGVWLEAVLSGRLPRWAARAEAAFFRLCGIPTAEMSWRQYALAVIVFSAIGVFVVYAFQRLQQWLPLNPQAFGAVTPDSAMNTAVSFVTNTNWQGYSGESAMSHLTQMTGLAVQNFFSAATGIAVAFALIRGLARHVSSAIGNFWVDVTRITAWVLVPISFVLALLLVSQGVVQNLSPFVEATLVEPVAYQVPKNGPDGQPLKDAAGNPVMEDAKATAQVIPMGPIASQEAIKELGTNGGGIVNANSAHPFENPNALTNFLEMLAIFLIPGGLCIAFGRAVGDVRQGFAVLAAMTIMFVVAAWVAMTFEQQGNPLLAATGVDQTYSAQQAGGNMEGKETRFGIGASALFATITTAASCGAVNGMHDSFTPLGGLVPLWLIQLGEVVFGGVGSGLYGMLVFALLAVFIAGLMVGRTPEYLGKKIESFEMKMVSIAVLMTPFLVLLGTAVAVMADAGKAGVANPAAHGFSEILYAFSSAANNNGSAFAGLSANTPFYNGWLAVAMWFGRFGIIVPVLAIAGALAAKKRSPVSVGSMPTHGPLFVVLLIGSVLLVGALTYVPALALGPVVEHLTLHAAR